MYQYIDILNGGLKVDLLEDINRGFQCIFVSDNPSIYNCNCLQTPFLIGVVPLLALILQTLTNYY